MIRLGNKVRDNITGYSGIAVGRTEWLFGCARIGVESPILDKDGKPQDTQWFDEQRIELVEDKAPVVSPISRATRGGPKNDPTRPRSH